MTENIPALEILVSYFLSLFPYLSAVVFDVRFTQNSTIKGTFLRKQPGSETSTSSM